MTQSVEYVVMFNDSWPDSDIKTVFASFNTLSEAADELIGLLNAHYPGRWKPENALRSDLRFSATDAVGATGLLGCVEKVPARLERLLERQGSLKEDEHYFREQLSWVERDLKVVEEQIAALRQETK